MMLMAADRINSSGLGKVWFTGQGTDNTWQMKCEMLSPRYTGSVWISKIIVR
ncbi:DUF4113 domain-containing protein [Pantoea sp. Bo_2]|uniref:DUF4113 domain-containing protein n=1 Tax=Candidatus Pantoea gossypiicola TaxID=2608008 RepID=A0AB34CD90_9GAMM|nr:DUF4113 domain-containing protein [Pantoea sp. VH_8]KAA5928487.1 DUF4113 domain-containing protein [Pantoea sp. VH_4]KAA5936415.1 DUF4113 domain-containing protein [Pantoea sp. VH_3]KAA5948117.1 DUF4113 domain-containing protein [Pantoea sp. VH_25]KAA5948542.1 DUF4113 domain-containing protein [Pantoea sp. VH_24]KAA5952006.1 DUF4113 domain-containing protein [Pantoea sp. VH_16]KAA5958227.1 DUF4113 domain-containing protein [Pantoea sp. VH_18]KAA5977832.1 DUF4113 domain-containing protein 